MSKYDPATLLGNVTATALDVDANGAVTYAGSDRISATDMRYVQDANGWWRVTSNKVWHVVGQDTALTVSVGRERMTGLGVQASGVAGVSDGAVLTSQSESVDWRGNVTRSSAYTDVGPASVWQVTEKLNTGIRSVQKTVGGIQVMTVSPSCVINTFTYDGFARQTSATDGRGNTSRTVYNTLGQVGYAEDAASNRTSYAYEALGRRDYVIDALSNTVHTVYDAAGRVIRTEGATYPVEYGYDTQGRMTAMRTFRDENGAGDETRWLYSNITGLLTNKVYADGKGTAYSYASTGKLASRTWARGITTSYTYDTLGQLTAVDYSDGTPGVAYTYDRLGRQLSTITPVSTNTVEYYGLVPVTEIQNGNTLDRRYDNSKGNLLDVGINGQGPVNNYHLNAYEFVFKHDYDYFSGQVISLYGGQTEVDGTWYEYTRLSGSDLAESITSYRWPAYTPELNWKRSYEPARDLITVVSNFWGTTLVTAYVYENDAVGRRTTRFDSTQALSVTNTFGYNVRSEVTSAMMGANTHSYRYDPIGNRVAATNNAEAFSYSANALNQYTNISDGVVLAPTYDDDGNMTSCGPWTYTWDAENRLASVLSNNVLVVTNVYDHMGRRILKISGNTRHAFLYDGWNPVREVSSQESVASTNYYTWGLDLSGTMQGAGGVGGLLAVTKGDGNVFCSTYDANGNITAYLDSNGVVVAQREYDAFGNTVSCSGSMAGDFAYWFSTKYLDAETGMYYYGYRFYHPDLGRWVSHDPIGEGGGANIYGFVQNNGVNLIDLDGRREWNPGVIDYGDGFILRIESYMWGRPDWDTSLPANNPGASVVSNPFGIIMNVVPCNNSSGCFALKLAKAYGFVWAWYTKWYPQSGDHEMAHVNIWHKRFLKTKDYAIHLEGKCYKKETTAKCWKSVAETLVSKLNYFRGLRENLDIESASGSSSSISSSAASVAESQALDSLLNAERKCNAE